MQITNRLFTDWKRLSRRTGRALLLAAFLALGPTKAIASESRTVSSLRWIKLGGVTQAVLIRGENDKNPVLLFVHGGPGLPEMPFSYKNRELERDFVIVQWDQRGTGKSYRRDTPGMTVDQFVRDTLQLARYLRDEFGNRKIYLVGYSWGSLVALEAVAREPELFQACVSLSQLVNIPASERELDLRSRAVARATGNRHALAELERLGHYPYANHRDERTVNKIQKKLMGEISHELTPLHTAGIVLGSPDYTLVDISRMISGLSFSGRALEKEIYAANLFRTVTEIDVPIYFFEGRHDTVLSPVIAHRYFEQLVAPRGKHFIWFDDSNHWLQMEEPATYRRMMRRVLRETRTQSG